jgi:hypothetical protein
MPAPTPKKLQSKQSNPVHTRFIAGSAMLVVFVIGLLLISSQNNSPKQTSPVSTTASSEPDFELRVEPGSGLASPSTGSLLQGSSLGKNLEQDSQNIQSSQSPQSLPSTPTLQGSGQN